MDLSEHHFPLCRLLGELRDDVIAAYVVRLPSAGSHYATRSPEELRQTTGRAVDAYLSILCLDDWGPMDAFIEDIARQRFALHFPLSEVQQAFSVFREICRPLVTARAPDGSMDEALGRLDATVDLTINRFSDLYQGMHLEEIRHQSEAIEDANRRLRAQMEEVAEAARFKNQFFTNMSHELRSPLNSILGYAELLLDGVDGPLGEAQRHDVQKILSNSRYLFKLINNILEMTRIEAGRIEIEPRPFDVDDLVRDVVDTVRPLAWRKRLEITGVGEGEFVSDVDKVKQLLINLMANAVKFTEQGWVTCEARGGGTLWVEVTDTGVGIAPADRERIFQKFTQLETSGEHEYPGTGLGLALCRMLVEALGGELGFDSEPGRGSRFWFRLPALAAGKGD